MGKVSLTRQVKGLIPIDSQSKIDELIRILKERNSSIDCYLEKWIYSLISPYSLEEYFKLKSVSIKRSKPTTENQPFLADILVKYYPIEKIETVDEIFNEFKKKVGVISQSDFAYAFAKLGHVHCKQRWEKLYKDEKTIKLHIDNNSSGKSISVPQPLATLIVTGAVDKLFFENYFILNEGDTIYVHASSYSSEVVNKLKYDYDIWSKFHNGLFTGSYTDDDFPENSYIGKFIVGKKLSKGIEEVLHPLVFDIPKESEANLVQSVISEPSHTFEMKHVELCGRTIITPVSDEVWEQIENTKDDAFFYWEKGYNKIIKIKSFEDIINGIWDDEDEEEDIARDDKGLYDIIFINGNKQKLCQQNNPDAVRRENYQTLAGVAFDALVFSFKDISITKEKDSSFDILQKREWLLDWNCVRFKRDVIIVSAPLDGAVKFHTKAFQLNGSMESFNYLKDYLNDRLNPVHCSVEKMELMIYDKIRLNEAIEKFSEYSQQRGIKVVGDYSPKRFFVPQQISFNQAMSKAKQMNAAEFEQYKSEYINFLVKKQSNEYKVIPCVERLAHIDNDTTEYAFIFTLICNSGDILIVHENVHPDRSTLLFVVKKQYYERAIHEIYDFLQSSEINKRSSLRNRTIDIKKAGIEHYRSINHDSFYSWSHIINNYLLYYMNGFVLMI